MSPGLRFDIHLDSLKSLKIFSQRGLSSVKGTADAFMLNELLIFIYLPKKNE